MPKLQMRQGGLGEPRGPSRHALLRRTALESSYSGPIRLRQGGYKRRVVLRTEEQLGWNKLNRCRVGPYPGPRPLLVHSRGVDPNSADVGARLSNVGAFRRCNEIPIRKKVSSKRGYLRNENTHKETTPRNKYGESIFRIGKKPPGMENV